MTTEVKSYGLALATEHTASLKRLLTSPTDIRHTRQLVVVSNRLPVVLNKNETGEWQIRPASGGLITALSPVLRRKGGTWIGWPGMCGEVSLNGELDSAAREIGCNLRPVILSEDERSDYYLRFSNETLWPLFHGLQSYCKFDQTTWDKYRRVNRKFAAVAAENSVAADLLWVHDYHLLLFAQELRRMGVSRQTVFFLHTPFPPADIFVKLPWHSQIMKALLEYDLVGFQTRRDKDNFTQCLETMLRGIRLNDNTGVDVIILPERETRVGVFPISIDFNEFSQGARERDVVERVAQLHRDNQDCQIILGVDRLDYSKGIPLRLKAFKCAVEQFPDLRRKVTLLQIVVPSREELSDYRRLKAEIEGLVTEINNSFAEPGWVPVQCLFRSLPRHELLAHYRAASIALVTPLRDGMNLVAKEYCAANLDENGVLILSRFAGAAAQLKRDVLLVNPYDTGAVARAIYRAFQMGADERKLRMRRLRNSVRKHDIYRWADRFLRQASPAGFKVKSICSGD